MDDQDDSGSFANHFDDDSEYVSRAPVPESDDRLRVYIACSLTGDDSTGLRDRLLPSIADVFRKAGYLVHNPSDHTRPGSPHRDFEVTAFDHLHAMSCDLIYFIRLQPSLGMGIEAQIAAEMLIPWGDAKSSDCFKLTPLLQGLPNPASRVRIPFDSTSPGELERLLRGRLRDHGGELQQRLFAVRRAKRLASKMVWLQSTPRAFAV